MPKPYDDAMKKLVGSNPQDFLSWVLRDAQFVQQLPNELSPESIYADALIEAIVEDEPVLVHFEFQSRYDANIGKRLLEYNVLASRQYEYEAVYSFVIYLRDCGEVPQTPFIRKSRGGKEIIRFDYGSIELHKFTSEALLQTELTGLAPLLPLTRDGARRETIEEMIASLVGAEQEQNLWIGYALASKVMQHDLQWLKWRFAMFSDFLRDSPVYQEVLEEGLEKGMEKGMERGMEKARQEEVSRQREVLVEIALERFPELVRTLRKAIANIDDPAILLRLIVKTSTAQTAEEIKQLLRILSEDDEQKEQD